MESGPRVALPSKFSVRYAQEHRWPTPATAISPDSPNAIAGSPTSYRRGYWAANASSTPPSTSAAPIPASTTSSASAPISCVG